MATELPPVAMLRKLLRYEPETGKLFWACRARAYFSSTQSMNAWNSRHAGKEAFTAVNTSGYRCGGFAGQKYTAHRVCFAIFYGRWPTMSIDHGDRNKLNNRISNLRECTHADNCRNRGNTAANKSGHAGIAFKKSHGKWVAYIGQSIHLGVFSDFDEAVRARQQAERYYGYNGHRAGHQAD